MNIWRGIRRFFGNLSSFLRETRAELKKVIWPSWSQVRVFTLAVVFMMIGVGVVLWGTDGVLTFLMNLIVKK
ncbi:MAG TPA: preprotein translocase subunit SecE [Firmicutes bacterium]|nr:preprotein translocase subunit SecE [Candidatus Fermentithermobacillaceae bacterium]